MVRTHTHTHTKSYAPSPDKRFKELHSAIQDAHPLANLALSNPASVHMENGSGWAAALSHLSGWCVRGAHDGGAFVTQVVTCARAAPRAVRLRRAGVRCPHTAGGGRGQQRGSRQSRATRAQSPDDRAPQRQGPAGLGRRCRASASAMLLPMNCQGGALALSTALGTGRCGGQAHLKAYSRKPDAVPGNRAPWYSPLPMMLMVLLKNVVSPPLMLLIRLPKLPTAGTQPTPVG